ncbi:hypothetical protein ACOMHN_021589 [Nucella lapillus]
MAQCRKDQQCPKEQEVRKEEEEVQEMVATRGESLSGEIDVYLDDHHLLEYEVARMDKDCEVQFVGKGFGSDGYAIGLRKKSWMRAALSDKILSYTDSGFIQELSRKYMMQSRCGHFLSGNMVQYGLEHTGGLFIILLSAVFVSVLLLFVEHLAYR